MRRYIAAGIILLSLGAACQDKKKAVRVPPKEERKEIVLLSPVEISLPSVDGDAPKGKESKPVEKPMSLAAKTAPVPTPAPVAVPTPSAPVKYEDVSSHVLAEGSREEAKDQGLARIRERALLRMKEMQDKEKGEEEKADAGKVASAVPLPPDAAEPLKVAMAEPEVQTESADIPLPGDGDSEAPVVIKSGKIDSKTAKNLELKFNTARKLAKIGRVEDAKSLFLTICQAGHAHACHKFAWYEELAGNTANATRFYRAACAEGLGKSCNNLAFQFERIKAYDKALELYEKGCKDKHEASCVSLKRIQEEQRQESLKTR